MVKYRETSSRNIYVREIGMVEAISSWNMFDKEIELSKLKENLIKNMLDSGLSGYRIFMLTYVCKRSWSGYCFIGNSLKYYVRHVDIGKASETSCRIMYI